MGLVIPFSGWVERGYIDVFGALFLVALIKGFIHVRAGRVKQHREWMIRAFAIGLSIATQRLIFVPALFIVADPTHVQLQTLSATAFLAAFVVHASAAEAWIHLTRRRSVHAAGVTKASYEQTAANR